jgi:hypothetical protein
VLFAIAALNRRSQVLATSGLITERGNWPGLPSADGGGPPAPADSLSPAVNPSPVSGLRDTIFNFVDS